MNAKETIGTIMAMATIILLAINAICLVMTHIDNLQRHDDLVRLEQVSKDTNAAYWDMKNADR